MSVLLFLLVLFILVLVHEFGHFIVAKRTGMRVDEFGIGFPPRLFGRKIGETLYSFNLLPLGGFVKIFGENAEDAAGDSGRSFIHKSKWAQGAVLIAGVTANIIFAWLLFSFAYLNGVETTVSENDRGPEAHLAVLSVLANSPAEEAGILPNDRLVAVQSGAESVNDLSPSSVSDFIASHSGEEIIVSYLRNGDSQEVLMTPEIGVGADDNRARIGIAMGFIEKKSLPIHEAFLEGAMDTVFGLTNITVGVAMLITDTVKFDADLSQVAGPVGIAGLVGDASRFGLSSILIFTAYISLNLAIINLLPLPALDGGRLMVVLIEAVRRKPLNPRIIGLVNTLGFFFLIGLMILVTYSDIAKLF